MPDDDPELVEILDFPKLRAMVEAAQPDPVHVVVLPDAAPAGTAGWVYTVTRLNERSVTITPRGGGRPLRIHPFYLAEASERDIRIYDTRQVGHPGGDVRAGSVVRLAGRGWGEPPEALFVVTALHGMTAVSVARLGGGHHWGKVPRSLMAEVIAPGRLAEAIAADARFTPKQGTQASTPSSDVV